MRKFILLISALIISLLIWGCGKGKEAGKLGGFSETTYSATMVNTVPGMPHALESKFYRDGDKLRSENKTMGMTRINITRQDKKVVWTLMPENKTYRSTL